MIYENIRRIIVYLLADDFSELFVFFLAMIFGWPLPLLAVQILWINLIEDSFPNIALTTENDKKGLMQQPPRNSKEPLLSKPYKKFMILVFFISGIAATIIFWLILKFTENIELARTMTFVLISFDSLVFMYIIRNFHQSILRRDIFSNQFINLAAIISIILLIIALYIPFLANLLQVEPLSFNFWLIIIGITLAESVFLEIFKLRFFQNK
jgi:Ca2+-transporting ATPase